MFSLAISIGIYSYIIFTFGVFGLIYKPIIFLVSSVYFLACTYLFKESITNSFNQIRRKSHFLNGTDIGKNLIKLIKKNGFTCVLLLLLFLQTFVNLIGVFGPEISFDALWYHLTLPKLYILGHGIFHIPGNLLFYSDMPKLTEMLYIPSLMYGNELVAKLIHFAFGILSLIAIYEVSRKFLPKAFSILAVLVFYSSLVVGWESISAYIDLARTFFEIMSLWAFLNWVEKKQNKWLVTSAIMLGFAISSKVIALESLIIFLSLFIYQFIASGIRLTSLLKNISTFIIFSVLIPLPWFVFSFINTGNPLYPFFDNRINIGTSFAVPNILNIIKDIINLFIYSSDPISPIYLAVLPLLAISFTKAKREFKIIYIYSLLGLLLWYLTPRIGGGRFILAYLPAFSALVAYSISTLRHNKLKNFLLMVIIFVSLTSISYRTLANKKYIPVVLGKETKGEFLTKNLNFTFGDFYDTDSYFRNNIGSEDRVLLYGFHNLYYVDFSFIDSSWVKKGDKFNYIAVQNSVLPKKFNNWQQIYYNPVTKVKLYSLGGKQWVY
ncbi:MAG: glycosyltransferase family 39 protein [Patescibacteria group bacterium]|nr:glycosyltransferase family 39 protein [Patescibacteria group bacterium]